MEVRTLAGLAEAGQARGAVVVLDIFRASNTILALLAAGAAEVRLLADLEQARALRDAHPDWLLAGERGGLIQPGFDGDNSPAHAATLRPAGRSVILTTSAGTQAVHRLGQAGPVCYGSFANAEAVVRALTTLAPERVNLLPMGLEAREPAREDDLAAFYLAERLAGRRPDFAAIRAELLACDGAMRLRRLGQQDDLEFCARLDSHELVPLVGFEQHPVARPWPGQSPRERGGEA